MRKRFLLVSVFAGIGALFVGIIVFLTIIRLVVKGNHPILGLFYMNHSEDVSQDKIKLPQDVYCDYVERMNEASRIGKVIIAAKNNGIALIEERIWYEVQDSSREFIATSSLECSGARNLKGFDTRKVLAEKVGDKIILKDL